LSSIIFFFWETITFMR